jgi:hypothetical protein
MSGLALIATEEPTSRFGSFVPEADLLNHLVGDSPDQTRLLMFSVAD